MELWKIHKFCETASLDELRSKEKQLIELIEKRAVNDTNAATVLKILQESIAIKTLFD